MTKSPVLKPNVRRGPEAKSCDCCRKWKKKCDSVRPSCGRCLSQNQICTYNYVKNYHGNITQLNDVKEVIKSNKEKKKNKTIFNYNNKLAANNTDLPARVRMSVHLIVDKNNGNTNNSPEINTLLNSDPVINTPINTNLKNEIIDTNLNDFVPCISKNRSYSLPSLRSLGLLSMSGITNNRYNFKGNLRYRNPLETLAEATTLISTQQKYFNCLNIISDKPDSKSNNYLLYPKINN